MDVQNHIKLRYLKPWLKDQLGHPGWFRRLVVDRTAWGAFSIYAHLKKSSGEPKIMHRDRQKAVKQAESLAKSHQASFEVYKCLFCEGWHVSRVMGKEEKRQEALPRLDVSKYLVTVTPREGGLDVDRIMATLVFLLLLKYSSCAACIPVACWMLCSSNPILLKLSGNC